MTGNILDSMTEQYNSLTRSGKKLADYIFTHTSETQYMSITSLAENCGVSEATITRFCRVLGLSGYNDLKLALAKSDRVTDLGDPSDGAQSINHEDDFDTMCRKIHSSSIVSLNETLELLNEAALVRAVNLLSGARHVYCFGQGGSMVMAMEAWARFSTVSSNFIHIEDSHMQAMAAALATSKDVILFFSYSGSTRDMEEVLKLAEENKVRIILITHLFFCAVITKALFNPVRSPQRSVRCFSSTAFFTDSAGKTRSSMPLQGRLQPSPLRINYYKH